MQSWSPLHLSAGSDDKDSYLSSLTAYLASNPTASLASLVPSTLSSPENSTSSSSDSNSPASSSDGPTPAPSNNLRKSMTGTTASSTVTANGATKRKEALSSSASNAAATNNSSSSGGALKDRRASGGVVEHTHQNDLEDNDDEVDGDGKKGTGKTSERRRAQNRAAQRNFRERKEKHLKELEDRVLSLEQQTTEQLTENSALKQLLERLQSENERLKVFETAFSFTYAKDVSNSAAMPTSAQFGGSTSVPTSKPPTPPTVQDEVDDLANYGLSLFGSTTSSPSFNSTTVVPDLANNPFANASLFPSLSAGPSPSSSNSSPSPLVGTQPTFTVPTSSFSTSSLGGSSTSTGLDDSLFLNTLTAPSPASTTGDSTSGSSANLGTPPDLSSDLFSAYRDPTAPSVFSPSGGLGGIGVGGTNFPDFDSLFGGVANDANALDDQANFSQFFSATSPSAFGLGSTPSTTASSLAPVSAPTPAAAVSKAGTLPCGAPSPEKFSFDVDGLCSELTKKAVCREAAKQALKEAMREDGAISKSLHPGL